MLCREMHPCRARSLPTSTQHLVVLPGREPLWTKTFQKIRVRFSSRLLPPSALHELSGASRATPGAPLYPAERIDLFVEWVIWVLDTLGCLPD